MNMEALARCAEQVHPIHLNYIDRAGKAFGERELFRGALRRLVEGIDKPDGSVDHTALAYAKRVLGIET